MASDLEQLRPAQPGGRRRLHFDNGRWEDYHSITVEHPSGRWDRILIARDHTGAIAEAVAGAINGQSLDEKRLAVALRAVMAEPTTGDAIFAVGRGAWDEFAERVAREYRAWRPVAPSGVGGTDG